MTNRALFDCDADGGDAGFVATFGETMHCRLRSSTGVTSWVLQVWNPDGFAYGVPLLDNAPRSSKGAPLLTLNGATSGQSVSSPPTSEITTSIPASGINSWIVRSVVNGGMSGNPAKPDPDLIHERLVVTTSSIRKPAVTEVSQWDIDSWAGVICDLVDAVVGSSGGGGGVIVGGSPLPGYTITANGLDSNFWSLGPGFFVVGTHTLRDGLPTYQTPRGTLVLTLDDGLVWEVASVGPVVYALWSGMGGVTSWNGRAGAVVPATNDFSAGQIANDSSVTGSTVRLALNNLLASLTTLIATVTVLVTGVSSVFARVGAIVAAVGDYLASQITNDSTVPGSRVSDALNSLKAAITAGLVFQTIANLVTFDASALPNGSVAAVETPLDFYELEISPSAALIAATDGVSIVQPTTPSGYRWIRRGLAYSFVSDWYVDGAGNDANDGSIGAPLKTKTELCRRLFPGGASRFFFQNTTVHVAAGTYADGGTWNVDGPFTLTIQCAFTSGSPITLSAVTNTVAGTTTPGSGTRGQIATASGIFAVGQMLRCTSGSHVGAVAYVQELNGDAQHAFVTHWHTSNSFGGVQVSLTTGDVVVVDTNAVDVQKIVLRTNSNASGILISRLGSAISHAVNISAEQGGILSIRFDLCQGGFNNSKQIGGSMCFSRCQGSWGSTGGYLQFQRGNHFTSSPLFIKTNIDFSGGDCFLGGLRLANCNVALGLDVTSEDSSLGMQFERCSGVCIDLGGSTFSAQFELPIWGVTGGLDGIDAGPASRFVLNQTQKPTIAASSAQVRIGGNGGGNGKAYTYLQMPVMDRGIDSGFVTSFSSDASVPLVTKTALVTATNLYAANPPAGQYAIGSCLTITQVGVAGAIAVFAEWTDDTGVAQKRRITSWLALTAIDNADGQIMIRTNGTSQVQYSVESQPGTFTITGLQYELSLVCERKAVP